MFTHTAWDDYRILERRIHGSRAESGLVLGASVLAVKGAELVHNYVQLMNAKVPCPIVIAGTTRMRRRPSRIGE